MSLPNHWSSIVRLTPRRDPRLDIGLDLIGRSASGIGTNRACTQIQSLRGRTPAVTTGARRGEDLVLYVR